MDCKTARLLIELERPWAPELAAADTDDLRSHLADCPDCATLHRHETRCDEAIGQAVRAVAVPAGLRQSILDRLEQPRWHQRPLVRTALAAAAVLLLAVGYVWWRQPVLLNLDTIAQNANDWPRSDATAVDNWFRKQDIVARVPRGYNYTLLTYAGRTELHGVQGVPTVTLTTRGGDVAHIFILDSRFDLDALDEQPHGSGRYTIQALPAEPGVPFRWIIKFTGGVKEAFEQVGPIG